jgi:drug/metabolite transporter (DMT)-like permease
LALAAVLIYGAQNVLLEQKLAKFGTPVLLTSFYAIMVVLSGLRWWQLSGESGGLVYPVGWMAWGLVAVGGLLYFAGDYCFISAYTGGGDLPTIATTIALFPVAATAMRYLWIGGMPSPTQILGFVLAAAAVYFVMKGAPAQDLSIGGVQ